jgi:predicted NAD/FAD-binding protein
MAQFPEPHSSKMSSSQETKTRVAIVGSGVAGLAAFWALHRSSESMVKAHLYEKHDDFGGHVVSTRWEDTTASVDVAFSLFNKQTYRNISHKTIVHALH